MAGRKRKPDHLKVVQGTAQACRMNPAMPRASTGAMIAPATLAPREAEVFGQIATILERMGIASPDAVDMLWLLARRIVEIEELTVMIEDWGRTYETRTQAGGRMIRARPEVAMRNEAMRHAQSLLAEFGLSPASVSKVSSREAADTNPFAALGQA